MREKKWVQITNCSRYTRMWGDSNRQTCFKIRNWENELKERKKKQQNTTKQFIALLVWLLRDEGNQTKIHLKIYNIRTMRFNMLIFSHFLFLNFLSLSFSLPILAPIHSRINVRFSNGRQIILNFRILERRRIIYAFRKRRHFSRRHCLVSGPNDIMLWYGNGNGNGNGIEA